MAWSTFALVALAFAYAIAPYALLTLAFVVGGHAGPPGRRIYRSLILGVAGFCLLASLTTVFGFTTYRWLHAGLTLAGVAAVAWRWAGKRGAERTRLSAPDRVLVSIVVLALVVRLVPLLLAGETFGGNDARFHNILARKIVVEDGLSATWSPIAEVPVVYPRGVHVLCAFIAKTANVPVHSAFNGLFPIIGALTVGMIYLLGRAVFRSRRAGLFAAAVYAFLPGWGSLDYFRWGGLPNAVGMLLLCAVLAAVLRGTEQEPESLGAALRRPWALGGGLALAAVSVVHHHSFLVTLIVLVFALIFATPDLRRAIAATGIAGTVLALPLLPTRYFAFLGDIGSTSVFVFREPPLAVWDCIRALNPAFVLIFVVAVIVTRRMQWGTGHVLVLSWFTALLAAFVFLEYVYRAGSLVVTGGADLFTSFTPSRMATDLAYPMSVLCGGLVLAPAWARRPRLATAVVAILAVGTCGYIVFSQRNVGAASYLREAGIWIRQNTPQDSLVVGQLPHLAYFSWRESSHPPLPASEPRNHPALAWKRDLKGLPAWTRWAERSDRPVYLVAPSHVSIPSHPPVVYENPAVAVYEIHRAERAGGRP